jgi:solute:Na+ symporter, SSS family
MVKSEDAFTAEDRALLAQHAEYQELKARFTADKLSQADRPRYEELDSLAKKGKLPAEISYIEPVPFYIAYTLIVAVYIILGGIKAAAITDAVQGLLIIAFSLIMIPIGLGKVGGFAGLHQRAPEHFFNLFGGNLGDYTWYSIAAIVLAGLVTFGNPGNTIVSASARDEKALRLGMLSGLFLKRFVMIAWMFCGLIAVALLPPGMPDPDATWGALARHLLGPGLMGIMITGMLLGHMPAVGVSAVTFSATFTRNVYEQLVPGRSAAHYLFVAKAAIAGVLILGVAFALFFSGVISLLSAYITFSAFFGATGFLIYYWRRLTARAVWIGAATWLILMTVVAWGLPQVESFRRTESLLLETPERVAEVRSAATAEDVSAGLALKTGLTISKPTVVPPKPVFFDSIARVDASDPSKGREGLGRFCVENWLLYHLGLPLNQANGAMIITCRWLFDAVFPFVLLIICSLFTRRPAPNDPEFQRIAIFHAKLKTPVHADQTLDAEELAESAANPARFDHRKLLPKTDWEFMRWERIDYLGFFGCWVGVLTILGFLWAMLQIGTT